MVKKLAVRTLHIFNCPKVEKLNCPVYRHRALIGIILQYSAANWNGFPMKRGSAGERYSGGAEQVEVLSSEQQDKVLQELRDTMTAQNRAIRISFGAIFYFVAAVYCFCLLSFVHEPWSLVHQQRFEFHVAAPALLLYYGVAGLIFVFCALVCQVQL